MRCAGDADYGIRWSAGERRLRNEVYINWVSECLKGRTAEHPDRPEYHYNTIKDNYSKDLLNFFHDNGVIVDPSLPNLANQKMRRLLQHKLIPEASRPGDSGASVMMSFDLNLMEVMIPEGCNAKAVVMCCNSLASNCGSRGGTSSDVETEDIMVVKCEVIQVKDANGNVLYETLKISVTTVLRNMKGTNANHIVTITGRLDDESGMNFIWQLRRVFRESLGDPNATIQDGLDRLTGKVFNRRVRV